MPDEVKTSREVISNMHRKIMPTHFLYSHEIETMIYKKTISNMSMFSQFTGASAISEHVFHDEPLLGGKFSPFRWTRLIIRGMRIELSNGSL